MRAKKTCVQRDDENDDHADDDDENYEDEYDDGVDEDDVGFCFLGRRANNESIKAPSGPARKHTPPQPRVIPTTEPRIELHGPTTDYPLAGTSFGIRCVCKSMNLFRTCS